MFVFYIKMLFPRLVFSFTSVNVLNLSGAHYVKKMTLSILLVIFTQTAIAKKFDFVALGDTAYNLPDDLPVYEKLIEKINAASPAFSIHVGDTWGALACSKKNQEWIRSWFQKYDHPLVYTPGDNEWTDCRKPEVIEAYLRFVSGKATAEDGILLRESQSFDGAFSRSSYVDSGEILNTIRDTFFSEAKSLSKHPMPLERQSDQSAHKQMLENSRWQKDGVEFATLNVPGSDMNFTINNLERAREAIERNKADVDWIKTVFAGATEQNAKAVVISLHASLFLDGDGGKFSKRPLRGGEGGPYYWIARSIRDSAEEFGKPVLLINGDFHELIIDRPFMVSQGEGERPKYGNITRLQVYGAPEIKAVKVSVGTETEWVFSFSPLFKYLECSFIIGQSC